MAGPFALVLVPDDDIRPTALGLVRCLGRAGVPVAVAAASRRSPTYHSTYVRRRFLVPSLNRDPGAWKAALARFGSSFADRPVLFASSDEQVLAVHHYQNELASVFRHPFLPPSTLRVCLDKRAMYERSRAAGMEVGFVAAVDPARLDETVQRAVLPCILKPAMWADPDAEHPHRNRAFMREFGQKAVSVATRDDLRTILRRAAALPVPTLLQELVPGPCRAIVHVSLYADRASTVRAAFVARKARQFPSQFGNACLLETESCPEAVDAASALVKAIGYHGIAGAIEFKRHPRTGRLHFFELNPRAAGSVSATASAGVNLPHLAYLDAVGEPLPSMAASASPVRWIEGRGDLLYWLSYRKGDHTGEPLPLRAYVESLRAVNACAYWATDDLLPWAVHAANGPPEAARAAARRWHARVRSGGAQVARGVADV